ncbi:hypothetical protein ACFU93_40860 [Streptomyces sp. NPDC057611]|uniref:hypothetical protein n=1 Tax=Streptomyces sp. NPDC057611 TaxID=3346182 RepID=UPI0036A1D4C7
MPPADHGRAATDDYTRPIGRMMTADLRALYLRDTDDQAVLRPLTRARSASPYERVRLAAGALAARLRAVRRSRRLGSRSLPHTIAVPAASTSRLRPGRADRKAGRDQEQATDVTTVEQTQRAFEAAAKMAASSRTASGNEPSLTAPGHSPPRRRPRRRPPSSPASSARPAGPHPQEESGEHTAGPEDRSRPCPRACGRPGARRRARAVALGADLEAAPDTEAEGREEAGDA